MFLPPPGCEEDSSMPDDLPLKCSWVVWQQRAASKNASSTSSSHHYEESTKQFLGSNALKATGGWHIFD